MYDANFTPVSIPVQVSYIYYGLQFSTLYGPERRRAIKDLVVRNGDAPEVPRGPKRTFKLDSPDDLQTFLDLMGLAQSYYRSEGRTSRERRIGKLRSLLINGPSGEDFQQRLVEHQALNTKTQAQIHYHPEDIREAQRVVQRGADNAKDIMLALKIIEPEWDVNIKVSLAEGRQRSWGGARVGTPFISIAATRRVPRRDEQPRNMYTFMEYASFRSDPVIGTVTSKDWRDPLYALTLHEMAHAFQYSIRNNHEHLRFSRETCADMLGLVVDDFSPPHGVGFRTIYAKLRENFNLHGAGHDV